MKIFITSSAETFIDFSAISPYPCPKEIHKNEDLAPCFSANCYISSLGSAPGDKININGVVGDASLIEYSKSKLGG